MPKYWIGVDLDGTLAIRDGSQQKGEIGEAIIPMLFLVKEWIEDGQEVRIFTARAADPSQIPKVENWLKRNGLAGLKVTNRKDANMMVLYDDKAVRVQRNTGSLCYMCQQIQGNMHNHSEPAEYLTDC
jgi:hypothetical protein